MPAHPGCPGSLTVPILPCNWPAYQIKFCGLPEAVTGAQGTGTYTCTHMHAQWPGIFLYKLPDGTSIPLSAYVGEDF